MKFKKIIKEVLEDWKHWFGWLLSSIVITLAVLSFINIFNSMTLMNSFLFSIIFIPIFIAEVIVDIFKHWVDLQ